MAINSIKNHKYLLAIETNYIHIFISNFSVCTLFTSTQQTRTCSWVKFWRGFINLKGSAWDSASDCQTSDIYMANLLDCIPEGLPLWEQIVIPRYNLQSLDVNLWPLSSTCGLKHISLLWSYWLGFPPQFRSALNSESCLLQPTQALALQDMPTPRERHATSAKPAKGSGRATEDGGSQTWHTAPLADSTEQLQQQRIPPEHPRFISEAISWVAPRESQEVRNTGACRQASRKLPQRAGELSYLTG